MNEPGKSDKPVVPTKFPKMSYWEFYQLVEGMKGRGLAKENGPIVQDERLPAGPAKQVDRTQSRLSKGDTRKSTAGAQ